MDIKTLIWLCENDTGLLDYPVSVYLDGKRQAGFRVLEDIPLNPFAKFEQTIFKSDKKVDFLINNDLLAFGVIIDNESRAKVLIGPVAIGTLPPQIIRNIIIDSKIDLRNSDKLTNYLKGLKKITFAEFRMLTFAFYTAVNHELIQDSNPDYSLSHTQAIIEDTYNESIQVEESTGELDGAAFSKYFEDRSIMYIKNGEPDKWSDFAPSNYRHRTSLLTSLDEKREFKDRCISSIAILTREAIEAGLDVETAYIITDLYILKIENATSIEQMAAIQLSLMRDLCTRVGNLKIRETANPTINRSITYVNEHLKEKLNTKLVAEALHISPNYLSTYFKQETGINFMNYISDMKIEEAKRLLKLTDKSLADISNYLSFSSQSYFQNVFKWLTGKTPTEYREDTKKAKN
ncbi:MAG: AraC family transcriptional regulator [Bacilli bacterium]|jgi:YesN/AraC family two-component response regulator|nr:AraC family transcriptional regulator [Bacilli bacterium]